MPCWAQGIHELLTSRDAPMEPAVVFLDEALLGERRRVDVGRVGGQARAVLARLAVPAMRQ
jgi:hypothetical protein